MRFRQPAAPLLLLLLPSLALASSSSSSSSSSLDTDSKEARLAASDLDSTLASTKAKVDVGTKNAPVDGKDGMPHEGPFVTTDKGRKKSDTTDGFESIDLPPLKNRPSDPTIVDGKKIPESNDGVMDDPHRQTPKQGTTGTEGGVSEKDKARKAKEGVTGERVENIPETPKEKPPMPHSQQQELVGEKDSKKDKTKADVHKTPEDVAGLEKPSDLPDKLHDHPNPLPDSAHKDHLDVSKPTKPGSKSSALDDDATEGIIRPFHSFVLSLMMILFSEVGDKTFLVAALMAMKHDRMVVFTAAFGALLVMTVLSAVLGHTLPALIPKRITAFLAAGLFFVFGAKLLREGMAMDPSEGVTAEMQEVEMELQEKEHKAFKEGRRRSSVSPYALEMGLGDRKSRSQSRFPTPPRSPSTSPGRSPSPRRGVVSGFGTGLTNLFSLLLSPAWVQTFIMTFLGEWGDRSQIATIAMAAGQDYWWVTLGAMLGHACCTGVAVLGGRAIAGKVSLKVVTVGGAVAFLVFGFIYLVEALYA
ncbi:Uu.00g112990.m01.CDS01 [Anthostomella pinea]|uniref:Uu.00g112990.m01.CDS01 n=1 Tax=Anthostomella pinea TaxID=933095 RepID=A0AAI8VFE4_9PEZI|nr:Uu.00g112990.m01.CDS01 [Anthostomella pinea]